MPLLVPVCFIFLKLVGRRLRKLAARTREAGAAMRRRPKASAAPAEHGQASICLAASGGGHLRQILELADFWRDHPHFFVTERTALGQSAAELHDTEHVAHVALGQAKLGQPFTMLRNAWRNCLQARAIIRRRRPRLVLTTGAGSMFFLVLWARLRGARIVLIDSFARFQAPSAFARLAGPLAHVRIAQSAAVATRWRNATVFEPLRRLPGRAPAKDSLLFATIGATLPFDRLVRLVLAAKCQGDIRQRVIIQAGPSANKFDGGTDVRIVDSLPQSELLEIVRRADIVICHGGTGSIMTALENHCRTIVVPRQFARGEHYDDHQIEITESFVQRRLVLRADDEAALAAALARARSQPPEAATRDYADLVAFLKADLLANLPRGTAQ